MLYGRRRQTAHAGIPRYEFEDGAFWGNMIASDIQAGASAWIYWNTILDQHGGPWMVSPVHNDPDPNAQHPVVIINRATKKGVVHRALLLSGALQQVCAAGRGPRPNDGDFKGFRALAFLSPEPEGGWHWVVELLKSRSTDTQVGVEWQGRSLTVNLPATSITTCLWNPTPGTIGKMPAP